MILCIIPYFLGRRAIIIIIKKSHSFRLRFAYIAAQSRFANTRCTSNNGPSLWLLFAWFAHIFLNISSHYNQKIP